MSIQFTPDTPATRRAFNRLAREKMKLRLLADIRMDLMVCELEGYSKLEYLDELLALVQELRKGGVIVMEEERLPLELWLKIYNQRERKANKQLICDKLCEVLQLTNRFYDLQSLEYVEENEDESHVFAKFTHGSTIVITSMDNSWGMILDIIRQLPGV